MGTISAIDCFARNCTSSWSWLCAASPWRPKDLPFRAEGHGGQFLGIVSLVGVVDRTYSADCAADSKNWTSQLNAEALRNSNAEDRVQFSAEELRMLTGNHLQLIQELAKKLRCSTLTIGTAIVFFKRFYLRYTAFVRTSLLTQPCAQG